MAEATVKRHLANVYAKLKVHSRQEAIHRGVAAGWIAYPDLLPQMIQADAQAPVHGDAAKYRCSVEGCGCEIVVVRASQNKTSWQPPMCHGRLMEQLHSSVGRSVDRPDFRENLF